MIKKLKEFIIKTWKSEVKKNKKEIEKEMFLILEEWYIKKEIEDFFIYTKAMLKQLNYKTDKIIIEKIKNKYLERKIITIKDKKNNKEYTIIFNKYKSLKYEHIYERKNILKVNDKIIIKYKKNLIEWNYTKFKKKERELLNLLNILM